MQCHKLQDGAPYKTLPCPNIINTWDKKNRNAKCNDLGNMRCHELPNGAPCKTLPVYNIIKTWGKKNRNLKCNDLGNKVNWWGKGVDWSSLQSPWKQGNWNGTMELQTCETDWASSRAVSGIKRSVPVEWLGGCLPPPSYKTPLPAKNAQQQWWLHAKEPRLMKLGVLTWLGLRPAICSNAFCVPKGTAWRLAITDYTHINAFNVAHKCRYETLRILRRLQLNHLSNAYAGTAAVSDMADQQSAAAGAEWTPLGKFLMYWLGFTPHPTKSVSEP